MNLWIWIWICVCGKWCGCHLLLLLSSTQNKNNDPKLNEMSSSSSRKKTIKIIIKSTSLLKIYIYSDDIFQRWKHFGFSWEKKGGPKRMKEKFYLSNQAIMATSWEMKMFLVCILCVCVCLLYHLNVENLISIMPRVRLYNNKYNHWSNKPPMDFTTHTHTYRFYGKKCVI